jgi:hypothetical protein
MDVESPRARSLPKGRSRRYRAFRAALSRSGSPGRAGWSPTGCALFPSARRARTSRLPRLRARTRSRNSRSPADTTAPSTSPRRSMTTGSPLKATRSRTSANCARLARGERRHLVRDVRNVLLVHVVERASRDTAGTAPRAYAARCGTLPAMRIWPLLLGVACSCGGVGPPPPPPPPPPPRPPPPGGPPPPPPPQAPGAAATRAARPRLSSAIATPSPPTRTSTAQAGRSSSNATKPKRAWCIRKQTGRGERSSNHAPSPRSTNDSARLTLT